MKAGFARLARTIGRIEARLDACGDGREIPIERGGGMRALRDAIARACAARGEAKGDAPAMGRLGPIGALREAILEEQERRRVWMAALPPGALGNEPAITDEDEEPGAGAVEKIEEKRE
jgi:hypothetical protein